MKGCHRSDSDGDSFGFVFAVCFDASMKGCHRSDSDHGHEHVQGESELASMKGCHRSDSDWRRTVRRSPAEPGLNERLPP